MGRLRVGILVATITLTLQTACGRDRDSRGNGAGGERSAASVPDTASDPGAQVARRIVKAATLEEAVAATRDGLTRGGLTISDFNRTTQPAL